MLAAPSTPPIPGLQMPVRVEGEPGLKTRYLSLQQEADFALWRAREANAELRGAYQAHLRGEGPPPAATQLAEIAGLERDAETRYRELRTFLREHFT